jgi:hypothetical protein
MCGTTNPGSCIRLVIGFGIKIGYDKIILALCTNNNKISRLDKLVFFLLLIEFIFIILLRADEDRYLGYHPACTQKAQGGVHYDSTHHPKDFRGPWHAQGVDNYIYKNICKIGK